MDEAGGASRAWLPWALVVAAAGAALWLASRPLDGILPPVPAEPALPTGVDPEPVPTRRPAPEPPLAGAPPAASPVEERVAEPTPFPEPAPPEPLPPVDAALRDTLERQLAMNDLAGVRVEIVGDRVITSGTLRRAGDRGRVALIVRSLAPELAHQDQLRVVGER